MSTAQAKRLPLFGVRCIFRTDIGAKTRKRRGREHMTSMIEDRVFLIESQNIDSAIRKAEKLARVDAKESVWPNCKGDMVRMRYLGACDAFAISAGTLQPDIEVYSRLLFLPKGVSNVAIVNRLIGKRGEVGRSSATALFEPDFERLNQSGSAARRTRKVRKIPVMIRTRQR